MSGVTIDHDSNKDTIISRHKGTPKECCGHEYREFSDFCSVPVNPRQTLMCNWMKYRYNQCLKKVRISKQEDR